MEKRLFWTVLAFGIIAIIGSLGDATWINDGNFWQRENETRLLAPRNTTDTLCLGTNCWTGYELSIEHNASIAGSEICTETNGLCTTTETDPVYTTDKPHICTDTNGLCTGVGSDNTSWNQTYANTLYAPITTTSDNTTWNETKANSNYVKRNEATTGSINTTGEIEEQTGLTQHGRVPVMDLQSLFCDFNVPYVTTMCYPNYLITIATGTPTKSASDEIHLGKLNFVNTAAANTGAAILTDPSQYRLNGSEWFQTSINYSAATLTNNVSLIQAGFIDTTAPQTESTDGVYFYIRNGWLSGRIANNSGRNFTTTNITLTRNSWYDLKIAISENGQSANFLVYNYTTQAGRGAPILQLNQTITSTSAVKIPNTAGRETGAGVTCGVTTAAFTAGTICQLDYVFTEVETQRRPNLVP